MAYWLIPLIVIIASLLTLVVILARNISRLRVVNVESVPAERAKRVKERLIAEHFTRSQAEQWRRIGRAILSAWKLFSRMARRIVQRLNRLEQHYQKLKNVSFPATVAKDPELLKKLFDEAEALARKGDAAGAEKRYVEVISYSPTYVEAYEGLGNLYLAGKQFTQAREALEFAMRLDAKNASALMSMADLEIAQGFPDKALEHLRKAVEIRPKNPRYLDAYLEAAFSAGAVSDAKNGLERLKEVNPENQKIPVFEERLKELENNVGG